MPHTTSMRIETNELSGSDLQRVHRGGPLGGVVGSQADTLSGPAGAVVLRLPPGRWPNEGGRRGAEDRRWVERRRGRGLMGARGGCDQT